MSPVLIALGSPSSETLLARHADQPKSVIGSYCGTGELALDALDVTVAGVGPLGTSISPALAQALHAASAPAPHGKRSQTVLDTDVRDTGQIPAAALALTWGEGGLAQLQDRAATALGLPGVELRAHDLLVYRKGQFFKPHQDSEKHDGMVATLVVVLPSAHIGGQLRLTHGKLSAQFDSQHLHADTLRWFVFYADCRHEVLPVLDGYRVVLSFDVVAPATLVDAVAPLSAELREALRLEFFPEGAARVKPWVLLLDHEYTEHGLRWALLKGADRERVLALATAAKELGLQVSLGLTTIHESWTAEYDEPWESNRGRRGRSSHSDDDNDHDDDDVQRGELIEGGTVLDFWVDQRDHISRGKELHLREQDVHAFSDTDDSFLVNQEHEGYMGNHGNTIDYWYRRAGVVIQTPLASEVNRFTTEFDAALADALVLARQGTVQATLELTQRLAAVTPILGSARVASGRKLLKPYVELACALTDPALARSLYEGFDWISFAPSDAVPISVLATYLGQKPMAALLRMWSAPQRTASDYFWATKAKESPRAWPSPLPEFVKRSQAAGLAPPLVEILFEQALAAFVQIDRALAHAGPLQWQASLATRLGALAELGTALQLAANPQPVLVALVGHIEQHHKLYPLTQLGPILPVFDALPDPSPTGTLRKTVILELRAALSAVPRAPDDFGMPALEWGCHCRDCAPVIAWAKAPTNAPLTLPLAEARRGHVQDALQRVSDQFDFAVLKQGSPHKLVIRKPTTLHAQASAMRQQWEFDLAALTRA